MKINNWKDYKSYRKNSNKVNEEVEKFLISQLPTFRNYRIKLVLSSTSQVYVPRFRDLRVIALA